MMEYESSSDDDDDVGLQSLDISNDQYYRTRLKLKIKRQQQENDSPVPIGSHRNIILPVYGSRTIKHSVAAYDLWKAFFPTYLNHQKFMNFHRPKLRHYNTGPQSKSTQTGSYRHVGIKNLTRHIFKNHQKLKNRVAQAIKKGVSRQEVINNFLRIRNTKDLTAKCGELFLFEYSEEYPPVLGQIGMASNIKNYFAPDSSVSGYRPLNISNATNRMSSTPEKLGSTPGKLNLSSSDNLSQEHTLAHKFPKQRTSIGYPEEHVKEPPPLYYCPLKPGTRAQMIENNLYRAPIFRHDVPGCDFLVIRTRNGVYVRSINNIFTVGQTMPLVQMPPPTERNITKFRCDLSNLHIHKLFSTSDTDPPSIKFETLLKLFPDYSRSTLRKRMFVAGAEPGRIKGDYVLQQGTSNYGALPWESLCRIITPEQYCAIMATLATRERLRELNYTETMINPSSNVTEIEPEILAAPWNVSRAITSWMKGQCFLDFRKHLIDPTGPQMEGFSCVYWSRSPTMDQQAEEQRANRAKANSGRGAPPVFGKNPMLSKIKAEKLERLAIHRREAQLIAQTQERVLSCTDSLTSSEDELDEQEDCENDAEFAQQLNDLDRLVVSGRSLQELDHEKEEEERVRFINDLKLKSPAGDRHAGDRKKKSPTTTGENDLSSLGGKILRITRTYQEGPTGERVQRTEIVREPKVIALYAKYKGGNINANSFQKECLKDDPSGFLNERRASGSYIRSSDNEHTRSLSLGPSELCRADGTRIRISKKVLNCVRPLRNCRRESTVD